MLTLRPGVTEESLKEFIGPNANKIIQRGSKELSWCWPGLLFPALWLAYRKAYLAAFLVFLIDSICTAWGLSLMAGTVVFSFHHPWLVNTLVRILVALFGLRYYLNFANSKIAAINANTVDSSTQEKLFKAKGKTSITGMLLFLILTSAFGTIVYTKGVQNLSQNETVISTTSTPTAAVQKTVSQTTITVS